MIRKQGLNNKEMIHAVALLSQANAEQRKIILDHITRMKREGALS